MSKHYAGGKFTPAHTSVIPAAEKFIKTAEGYPEVKRITLGRISMGKSGGQYHVKITPINGGLRAVVRGPTSIQEIYIYSNSPELTQRKLEETICK